MLAGFKKSIKYMRPFKWPFIILLIVTILEEGFRTFSTFFVGKVVDNLVLDQFQIAVWFGVIYLVSRIIPIILGRFSAFYELKTTTFRMENHFNLKALSESFNLSLGQIKNDHSGFKLDLISKGQNSLNNVFFSMIYEIFPVFATILVSLFGMAFIKIEYFYISLIFLVLYSFWAYYLNKKIEKPLRDLIEKRKEKNKVFVDILRSLFFIKFSGQKDFTKKQISKYQNKFAAFGERIWIKYHKQSLISDFILIAFLSVIILFLFRDFQAGAITIGMFLPVITWSSQFSSSLNRVKHIQRRLTISISDLNKLYEMFEQEPDVKESENPIRMKDFEESIKFENVSFDYKEGKRAALVDIDLEIKKGEKVALVGKSGSGKSTIVSLILRLYDPVFGEIMVDGADLRHISVDDWHGLISYVPQDGDLIDMTIRENVLFGARKRATKSEIERALKQAEAYDFVSNLPKGLETMVGERGVKLSGGQKQRICIARALVKNSPILILDEATSSLDSETEQFLNKNVWDILKDKTGIVIAHRLSTILDADKIVVIDDGKIIGVGKHDELLKSCDFYKKLVDAQNISF